MKSIDRVAFIGSKSLGLKILTLMHQISPESLAGAITIDDSDDKRSNLKEIMRFTSESRIKLHLAKNKTHTEELIKSMQPQLCIVTGWYWIFSEEILNSVPHGFIGIHNSLLPKLRGGAPLVWSIILDHQETGFSLFKFTPGMDDGPIYHQATVPIKPSDYISDILQTVEHLTEKAFAETYPLILQHEITPYEQDHSQATYCELRTPKDGVIDWNRPAREIYNFIRAQSAPYPGAYTHLSSKKVTIWKARESDIETKGSPGQISHLSSEEIAVVCGDNHSLTLEEIEVDGICDKAQKLITLEDACFS